MAKPKPKLHRNGTVSYWSITVNGWILHATSIPDEDLAGLREAERPRVLRHLALTGTTAAIKASRNRFQ